MAPEHIRFGWANWSGVYQVLLLPRGQQSPDGNDQATIEHLLGFPCSVCCFLLFFTQAYPGLPRFTQESPDAKLFFFEAPAGEHHLEGRGGLCGGHPDGRAQPAGSAALPGLHARRGGGSWGVRWWGGVGVGVGWGGVGVGVGWGGVGVGSVG